MQIDNGLVTAISSIGLTGFLGWAAYITKMLVEHARLLAILKDRQDRPGNPVVAFAARGDLRNARGDLHARAIALSQSSAILPVMIVKRIAAALTALAKKEPAVAIAAVAAALVELSSAAEVAEVGDWSGVALVAVSLVIRQFVSPASPSA